MYNLSITSYDQQLKISLDKLILVDSCNVRIQRITISTTRKTPTKSQSYWRANGWANHPKRIFASCTTALHQIHDQISRGPKLSQRMILVTFDLSKAFLSTSPFFQYPEHPQPSTLKRWVGNYIWGRQTYVYNRKRHRNLCHALNVYLSILQRKIQEVTFDSLISRNLQLSQNATLSDLHFES